MSPRIGRPPKDNPRNINLNIRITKEESERIQNCADRLNMTRTDTIMMGIDMVENKIKGELFMKVIVSQQVKIIGDNYPHNWSIEYESNIIPHIGDSIEDPIWKNPYDYKVIEVIIDYYANECFVQVEAYDGNIPEERKEDFAHMAELHGWKASWKMHK